MMFIIFLLNGLATINVKIDRLTKKLVESIYIVSKELISLL